MDAIVTLVLAVGSGSSWGQTLPDDAFERIEAAAAAALEVEAASFRAQTFAEGPGIEVPNVEAMIRMRRPAGEVRAPFRAELRVWMPAASKFATLDVGHDGSAASWAFRERGIAACGPADLLWPAYVGECHALIPEALITAEPYADALLASDGEVEVPQDVFGVPCEVVRVTLEDGHQERWFLGADDHLPRRHERLVPEGGRQITIWNDLRVGTGLESGFTATLAEGMQDVSPGVMPLLRHDEAEGASLPEFHHASANDPDLRRLREQYRLEELVAGVGSDLERVRSVCHWVHGRWQHDGNHEPQKSDPISILEEAEAGGRFRCVEYGIVASGCLNALGIPARVVGLTMPDVEIRLSGAGHVVAEAYLEDSRRWVLVDAQNDVVPSLSGRALNTVEFQAALRDGAHLEGLAEDYPDWARATLFFLSVPLDTRPGPPSASGELLLVPLDTRAPSNTFQRRFQVPAFTATHSLAAFYQAPPGA